MFEWINKDEILNMNIFNLFEEVYKTTDNIKELIDLTNDGLIVDEIEVIIC